MKIDLPVLILKDIILLPHNEIRIELSDDISKDIVNISELFHDNKLIIINEIIGNNLPYLGVIAQIKHKIELPNGKIRIILNGLYRSKIFEYMGNSQNSELLECINQKIDDNKVELEKNLCDKLYKEIENYIQVIPYVSNSILASLDEKNLSEMTDVVAGFLELDNQRKLEYQKEIDPENRLKMLLSDIYRARELFKIEKKIDSKVQKNLDDSQKEYLLREKIKLIKEEIGDVSLKDAEIEKLKEKINNLNAPSNIIETLNTELKRYESLSQASPEVNIVRNYIDWLLSLPWKTYTVDNDDLDDVLNKLNSTHNGLDKIKTRIIEYLAVKQMTNSLKSPIICLVGPPGVGKTSLAMSIASSINRQFVKMSVGGINDEAEIIGHRKTYIGAGPGRIIQGLKKAKSANPVFLIDEIDKMNHDYKGDPASVLLEILDPEQNRYFSDNYIEEEFDLSSIMFITTANVLEDIPSALRDRLEVIELSGYTEYEKLNIAKTHLIPKICKEHGINYKGIEFKDDAILKIIRSYTKEAGVRELERQIATIIRKIVTKMVTTKIIVNRYVIDTKKVEYYLNHEKYKIKQNNKVSRIGIVNALSYSMLGGDTTVIEVSYFKGNGNLILTGCLGEVMKESATLALSYIKANADYFKIDYNMLLNNDIHIHIPDGSTKKEGPSAGIAILTAMVSAFTNTKIDSQLAFTGEITLKGDVQKIGGLKEKIIGAYLNNIKTVILPMDNKDEIDELPEDIKKDIEFVKVENYKKIWEFIKEYKK